MTLPAIPPSIRVTDTTWTNRSPSKSRGSSGTWASASIPAAARWIALSGSPGGGARFGGEPRAGGMAARAGERPRRVDVAEAARVDGVRRRLHDDHGVRG